MFKRKKLNNEPIGTEFGIIKGREGIFLDLMEQKESKIIFYG